MAIANTPESFFNQIRINGFHESLTDLVVYAETQAKLNQSLGEQAAWEYWVNCWAALQRASDTIDFPSDEELSQQMWQEHQEAYRNDTIDFNTGHDDQS